MSSSTFGLAVWLKKQNFRRWTSYFDITDYLLKIVKDTGQFQNIVSRAFFKEIVISNYAIVNI